MSTSTIKTISFLPEYLQTDKNKKFLSSTIDQLIQPAQLERINGFIGSKLTPTYISTSDVYLEETLQLRKDYQLEPAVVINDASSNVQDVIALDDLINEIATNGGQNTNLDNLFRSDFYSYDPHIDWDKLINYQEYYWLVTGPETISITGQQKNTTSTYTVRSSDTGSSFIFNPNGLVENPLVNLYRGNTYHFEITSNQNFYIKTAPSFGDQDIYSYNVTNNGTSTGVITIVVNENTPNTLYYVSGQQQFSQGEFVIRNITQDSAIDVENEIVGRKNYISGSGITVSNGMKIKFGGDVLPSTYQDKEFFVEGVGSGIRLVDYNLLITPEKIANIYNENFDATPFDTYPFDNFKNLPIDPEYITINRSSRDLNPWSRYNRWVHSDVIKASAEANGQTPVYPLDKRAKRPIIEFKANLKLYNFGTLSAANVDLIDNDTTDAFSIVEGSAGYYVDGVLLEQGHRVIFNADTDPEVRGKIYQVSFNIHGGHTRLELRTPMDHNPINLSSIGINLGNDYSGSSWWFDGTKWNYSQQHDKLNQPPLFDLFDNEGNSYSDKSVYLSNFAGNKVFSYDVGTGLNDAVLGFPLKYKNSIGVGSYLFKNDFMTDTINVSTNQTNTLISTGISYCKFADEIGDRYANVWTLAENYQIPILQFQTLTESTSTIEIIAIDNPGKADLTFDVFLNDNMVLVDEYESISSKEYEVAENQYEVIIENNHYYIRFNELLPAYLAVLLKIYTNSPPNENGFYEPPLSLTNNPLNGAISSLTLTELSDHLHTMTHRAPDFDGVFPGKSNIRDLADIEKYGYRLITNLTPAPFAHVFIGKKEHSLVDALSKSSTQYNQFKLLLLKQITTLSDRLDPMVALDIALKAINNDKDVLAPYYLSDMLGYGTDKITRTWTITNVNNTVYPINSNFDPTKLSLRSILVYLNSVQLLLGKDYEFNVNTASITILTNLTVGDTLVVNDYFSTIGSFIPPTPTKLGLYPKFTPSIFEDTTYIEPKNVIQGHDGSIMVAYNDFRDDIILEFEKRVFNNIKSEYREELLDINSVIPGLFRDINHSQFEVNNILQQEFIKWAGMYGIDYITNTSFEEGNTFTWNYTKSYNNDLIASPVGSWRAVYKYVYGTDRPHTHPWEMLGFSEQPSWWNDTYGPAPYTSGNMILWNDIEQGKIASGSRAGIDPLYIRTGLSQILPVDENGTFLDPTVCFGLKTTPSNRRQSWKFGDCGPAETAWRRSSYWPFAVQRLVALTKPTVYSSLMYDLSRINKNIAGQWAYGDNEKFLNVKDVEIFGDNDTLTSGYSVYVSEVGKQRNSQYITELKADLTYLNLNLFYKVGGFISKDKLTVLIDAIDPATPSLGAILPQEDYTLILNVSNPIKSIGISGLIVQRVNGRFVVKGYSKGNPYFTMYPSVRNTNTPTLTIGGISESYVNWDNGSTLGQTGLSSVDTTTARESNNSRYYQQGQLVSYGNNFYRVKVSHQAESTFNSALYEILPSIPTKGGATIQTVSRFDKRNPLQVPYGTEFTKIQEVYDLIVGYGEWLQDQGFIFDEYNSDLNSTLDWNFTAKEFLYWTTQNWANNSVIALSPFSNKLKYSLPNSVVDNIFDEFYEYSILQANGASLPQKNLNVSRQDGVCTISTVNDTDGIYFATLRLVQKEHAMVFNNVTKFNDTVYSIETGYRQRRMKLSGFRTANWAGDYFSPGFVYDAAEINEWTPYKKYVVGDVIRYTNGKYYAALINIDGSKIFNFTQWTLLNKKPVSGLLSNFDYKINQFEDFYSLDIDNFDSAQQKLAQHLTGYTPRVYLNNIFSDPIAQYKFYQGFIKEKGTKNSITKLAKATIQNLQGEMSYFEEWAFRVGHYGSYQTYQELETPLIEGTFIENPQIITFANEKPVEPNDLVYYSTSTDWIIQPTDYVSSSSFPTDPSTLTDNNFQLMTAGYPKLTDIQATAYNEDSLLSIVNNRALKNGDVIWLGFKKNSDWGILRYTKSTAKVIAVEDTVPFSEITFITDLQHGLAVNDIASVSQFSDQVNGVYSVKSVPALNKFTVLSTQTDITTISSLASGLLFKFESARVSDYDTFPEDRFLVRLPIDSKIWVDNDGDGKWVVYQKVNNFTTTPVTSHINQKTEKLGWSISKRKGSDVVVVGAPNYSRDRKNGAVHVYEKIGGSASILFRYSLNDHQNYTNSTAPTEIGYSVVYDDTKFYNTNYGLIFAGAPAASRMKSAGISGGLRYSTPTSISSTRQNEGAVKISATDNSTVEEISKFVLLSPTPSNNERFGSSLYVQRNVDSKLLLVGANQTISTATGVSYYGPGHVYAYQVITSTNTGTIDVQYISEITTSTITSTSTGSQWGYSISGSDNAEYIAISAAGGTGVVHIFTGTTTNYAQTIESPFESGARFGDKVLVSPDASYLFISAPDARGADQSYGKVAIYKLVNSQYTLTSVLLNPVAGVGMNFGYGLDIDETNENLVVSALGTDRSLRTTFDKQSSIFMESVFDSDATDFYGSIISSGTAYLYNRKFNRFVLFGELSPVEVVDGTNYGYSVAIDNDVVYVGAPAYDNTATSSAFYQFNKVDTGINGWNTLREQEDSVAVDNIQRAMLIDTYNEEILNYLDIIDPLKGRISGLAEQELKYKSSFDPAVYTTGTSVTVNDPSTNWLDDHVGELWWDLSSVKYIWYEQGESSYRKNNWGKVFPGSTIDVYEWVGSTLLPSEWSIVADTSVGLTQGISGQPKYINDSVVSIRQVYNSITNSFSNVYYYWVKNKVTVPNVKNRRISSYQVSSLIADPTAYGLEYAAIISKDSIILSNVGSLLVDNRIHLNISIDLINNEIPKHTEWLLLQEGDERSVPNTLLEKKLFDSLLGHDSLGNLVPNPALSPRIRYGIGIRPQQSLFKDRRKALRNLIEFSNSILLENQITGNYSFENLNQQEEIPSQYSGEYDQVVEDNEGLLAIDTRNFKTAKLSCTVSNGKIRAVIIEDPGFGYQLPPKVSLISDVSSSANIVTELDLNGRVIGTTIKDAGGKYSDDQPPILEVRPYTAIVLVDIQYTGKWTKFTYDVDSTQWVRANTQKYNTTLYWKYVDWKSTDYNPFVDYAYTVGNVYELNEITPLDGDYVKVKNGGLGTYIILEKTSSGNFSTDYNIVYSENGTIQLLDNVWNLSANNFGFDQVASFDQTLFDQDPDLELGYILQALKNDIFVKDLKVNWNLFFFKAVKYALTEQKLLDWVFKTSFINVINSAGLLDQRPVYKLTSSTYYEQYLDEVKPYHTNVRSFTTNYSVVDPTQTYTTDFDLPAKYNDVTGMFTPIEVGDDILNSYPWKSWSDNYKFEVGSISVGSAGLNYTVPPQVIIETEEGDTGTGATAQAYIRSGGVSSIKVINPGKDYTKPPKVILIGGGDTALVSATAYAQLSNSKVRSNKIGIKFDRISQEAQPGSSTVTDKFTCDGATNQFVLTWLAQPNKSKINVYINESALLNSNYTIEYYTEKYQGYTKKFSKLLFANFIPTLGQIVTIRYEKSIELQTAADRILNYYNPTTGMPGKELDQLMSGIKYSKPSIDGLPFDYTTKWDIDYSPFGTFAWADDLGVYSTAKIVSTATTGSNLLTLNSVEGIQLGQFANIIADITNKFIDNIVFVTGIDTTASTVTLSSDLLSVVYANTTTDQIEFWSYDANNSSLDTLLDGGTWSETTSNYLIGALGINPADILLSGDGFYTPDTSYAPEELVPGQVTESIGINVYTKNTEGSPTVFSNNFYIAASTNTYTTSTLSIEPPSIDNIVVVYRNRLLDYVSDNNFTTSTQYSINWGTNVITIPPQSISGMLGYTIMSIGGGSSSAGAGVIDRNSVTSPASFVQVQSLAGYGTVQSAYVTVNGVSISEVTTSTDYGYILTYVNQVNHRAAVNVYNLPSGMNTVQAWFFGTAYNYYNEVNEQTFTISSTTDVHHILSSPPQYIEPADAQVIVEITSANGRRRLTPPYIAYYLINDLSNLTFAINDKADRPSTVYANDVSFCKVYLNGSKIRPGFDYSISPENTITLREELVNIDDVLAIVDVVGPLYDAEAYEYTVNGDLLTLSDRICQNNVGNIVKVMTFSDQDGMLMRTERFKGNPNRRFKISRPIFNINYVWVEINGVPLTSKLDFEVLDDMVTIQVSDRFTISTSDTVVITSIDSSKLSGEVLGYRIFNDMFNRTHFKRLSHKNTTYLTIPLSITDTEIHVDDATVLTPPFAPKKIPGVVIVDGERIEFFTINGNVLGQLRRGTLGTSPSNQSVIGTKVIDQGPAQTVPFKERILRQKYVTSSSTNVYTISTVSNSTIGDGITLSNTLTEDTPIERVGVNNLSNKTYISASDQVAIYYGGRLLRKSGSYYHDITVSYDSPIANVVGTTSTSALLPDTVNEGEGYITEDTNQVWIYTQSNEVNSVKGYVYSGLNYLPPEFTITTSTQQVTLNIKGGIIDDINLVIIKREYDRYTTWNTEVDKNHTVSLLDSDTVPAKFLQDRPADLPDMYYYGRSE